MAGFIPDTIIHEVQARSDVVEVISNYLPLKKTGRSFKALCPFHQEKTPSFIVSAEKQIFHCFGCGAGGNVYSFIMKYEGLEFPEAVRHLAAKAGVRIPEALPEERKRASLTNLILRANEIAVQYYCGILNHPEQGKSCREYLESRGIREETIREFKLGFSTKTWDGFLRFAAQKGISQAILIKAALVVARPDGGCYDLFRNRLVFPIINLSQKVIGFGARVLDGSLPKYINSAETAAYSKGKCLYGLGIIKEHIRQHDQVIVVEGYTDLLGCYQAGIRNVVASLGTALTVEHARLINRFTRNVVLIYDGDQAGEQATLRGLDVLIEQDLDVRIVSLPSGTDPDNFVRREGADTFRKLIDSASPLFDYKLEVLLKNNDGKEIENRVRIIGEMLPTISRIQNAVLKSDLIRALAERMKVSEDSILIEMKKVRSDYRRFSGAKIKESKPETVRKAEQMLIGVMLTDKETISRVKGYISADDFRNSRLKRIAGELFKNPGGDAELRPEELFNDIEDEKTREELAEILILSPEFADREKIVEDCIGWIKRDNLKTELAELNSRIEDAQKTNDLNRLRELTREYSRLIKDQKNR